MTPLVVLAVLGTFELGRASWTNHSVSHVAAEAARYASVRSLEGDDPATSSTVSAYASTLVPALNPTKLTVATTWEPSNERGSVVRVRVDYDFETILPLMPFDEIAISGAARRVITY